LAQDTHIDIPYGPNLNTRAAADYTGRCERSLEGDRLAGRGPRYLKLGPRGPVLYPKQFLDEWLASCIRVPGADDRPAA